MPVSKRGFKDFLYHVNKSKRFDSYAIKLKEPKSRPKVIGKSDVAAVLSVCRTSRDRFLVQLLWESGLRIGEALALWLEDIEPDARRIHVRERGELENLSEIKTVCSPRTVDVSPDLVNLFFDYIAEAHTDDVETNHVFIKLSGTRKGAPLDYSDAAALIRRLRERAGVHFTAHMLRHSSFSELRRLGWPVEQLRARAGHAFVQSTYVYLHSDDEDLRKQWELSEQQMNLQKGKDDNESGV
jgi:integrase